MDACAVDDIDTGVTGWTEVDGVVWEVGATHRSWYDVVVMDLTPGLAWLFTDLTVHVLCIIFDWRLWWLLLK